MKNIIIYRDHLLPISETFIKTQGENLKGYTPHYLGSRIVSGLELPEHRTLTINNLTKQGWIKEAIFKLTGHSPEMLRGIRKIKPALLHAHFGFGGAIALPIIKKLNLPFVISFHGIDATTRDSDAKKSFYSQRLYLRKREELKQSASLFIAVSKFIKRKLLEQGFSDSKIVQHYIGIDLDKFTADSSIERKNIVLFVARLVEVKGCKYAIHAIEMVQKMGFDVELVIIGDGPLRIELEQLAKKTLNKYRFLGVQPSEVVRYWMNRAKVFCVPSVVSQSGNQEAFGIVFAEANAMGVPVVSFQSGGIPEAVSHGETGFLVPEKDCAGLAMHIIRLFEDDQLWNKLSEQGIQRVHKLFNIKNQSKKLEMIYDSVIENSS